MLRTARHHAKVLSFHSTTVSIQTVKYLVYFIYTLTYTAYLVV